MECGCECSAAARSACSGRFDEVTCGCECPGHLFGAAREVCHDPTTALKAKTKKKIKVLSLFCTVLQPARNTFIYTQKDKCKKFLPGLPVANTYRLSHKIRPLNLSCFKSYFSTAFQVCELQSEGFWDERSCQCRSNSVAARGVDLLCDKVETTNCNGHMDIMYVMQLTERQLAVLEGAEDGRVLDMLAWVALGSSCTLVLALLLSTRHYRNKARREKNTPGRSHTENKHMSDITTDQTGVSKKKRSSKKKRQQDASNQATKCSLQ